MDARSYTDFDLIIEKSGDKYRARVMNSPAGQAAVEFDKIFDPLEVENFILRMGRPKRGMRRIDSSEMETIRIFGDKLFRTVFSHDVYACYMRSVDMVLRQNKGLRIRLRIDVPQFHGLPWEFLYNSQVDQFLALSKDTPIVRYMELPYTTQALAVKAPMKILVMISSPKEYPPLDVEEEWRRLNKALQPLVDRGQVVLRRLERPTLSALQQQLRQEPVHIFHFIGHGKYFEQQQDGMLLLEGENGMGKPTSGQQLGMILHDHHTLQLVVLNACEGARTSSDDPYTGVAQTLVKQGIPAVLANQFEIFEDAAVTLAQEFYGALADGYAVDAALSEARKAIFAADNEIEWGTPVLFMRIPNGVLFKAKAGATGKLPVEIEPAPKAAPQAEEKKAQDRTVVLLNRLYNQARNQMTQGDWPAAADLLEQIHDVDPEFQDVGSLLEEARARSEVMQRAAGLLARAQEQVQAEDLGGALSILSELLRLDPEHREALKLQESISARIEQVQGARARKAQLDQLYDQARLKMDAGDWAAAGDLLGAINHTEPGFNDVEDLLKQVRAEEARREELARLSDRAGESLSRQDWAAAVDVLQRSLVLDPVNAGHQELLLQAQRGQQIQSLLDAAHRDLLAGRLPEAIAALEAALKVDPSHPEASARLADAKTRLADQEREAQKAKEAQLKAPAARPTRPPSLPEALKSAKTASFTTEEEAKPRRKPGGLPK